MDRIMAGEANQASDWRYGRTLGEQINQQVGSPSLAQVREQIGASSQQVLEMRDAVLKIADNTLGFGAVLACGVNGTPPPHPVPSGELPGIMDALNGLGLAMDSLQSQIYRLEAL